MAGADAAYAMLTYYGMCCGSFMLPCSWPHKQDNLVYSPYLGDQGMLSHAGCSCLLVLVDICLAVCNNGSLFNTLSLSLWCTNMNLGN